MWVAVLGLLLGVLSSIISAVAADAHAALRSVTPGDGDTVAAAPGNVTLEFNEPIGTGFATVTVTGPSGSVGRGRPEVDATTVTQALADRLPGGDYTVAFRVVSEDGHPVSDTTTFTVLAPTNGTSTSTSTSLSSEPTMTPGTQTTPTSVPAATPTEISPAATASGEGEGQAARLGLAAGAGALAVAAGVALVALVRRHSRS